MITAAQLRAARALLGIDQRRMAELASLSLPTIQRMEASGRVIRGNVDSLVKLVAALDAAGIVLIGEGEASAQGGRGVRLKETARDIGEGSSEVRAVSESRGQRPGQRQP
jgi:transcriptional regulator with XRE-family HTH domain